MANIPITPLSVTKRYLRDGANTQLFTADRSVTWSSSAGTMSPSTGVTSTLTYPNFTRTITVTGVSGGDSGSASVSVYGTWPVNPHFGYEPSIDDSPRVSYAEDGSAVFRRKGDPKYAWSLNFNNTTTADMILMRDFWLFHRKDIPFYFEDLEFPENVSGTETATIKLVTADTGLKVVVEGPDRYTVSIAFKQV